MDSTLRSLSDRYWPKAALQFPRFSMISMAGLEKSGHSRPNLRMPSILELRNGCFTPGSGRWAIIGLRGRLLPKPDVAVRFVPVYAGVDSQ